MVEIKSPAKEIETYPMLPKERSACSILYGLRQKFSREANKDPKIYTSRELYKLFGELMNKLNKGEVEIYERTNYIENDLRSDDPIWGTINDAIKNSKIKRFRWKSFFAKSLTQVILEMKKKGYSPEKTYHSIIQQDNIGFFMEQHPSEKEKMLKNIRISVFSRYGENNTATKIMEADDGKDKV